LAWGPRGGDERSQRRSAPVDSSTGTGAMQGLECFICPETRLVNIGSSIRNLRAADQLRNLTLSIWGDPVAVHPRILKCRSGLTSPPLDSATPPQTRAKGASTVGASNSPTAAPLRVLVVDNAYDGASAPPAVQSRTRSFSITTSRAEMPEGERVTLQPTLPQSASKVEACTDVEKDSNTIQAVSLFFMERRGQQSLPLYISD